MSCSITQTGKLPYRAGLTVTSTVEPVHNQKEPRAANEIVVELWLGYTMKRDTTQSDRKALNFKPFDEIHSELHILFTSN